MLLAITLHILAAVIWIGGMFFAYVALRPSAAEVLEPPLRLTLWSKVFSRFFPWVWACIVALFATGYWMTMIVFGGFSQVGIYVHIMHSLAIIMFLIFGHVFFAPYKKLKRFVIEGNFPEAGKKLAQIRILIAINLSLGLITLVVVTAGPHML
jgi:uncharacterized membrane protein